MKSKTAIVTAGAGEIGAATARFLHKEGYQIAILDVSEKVEEMAAVLA